MQYLRRRVSSETIGRNAAAVEGLPDELPTVDGLAGRIEDAVLVELLRPGTRIDDGVYVPREHYDTVVDELYAYRRRIESYENTPLGLVAVGKSRLYRRGDERADVRGIESAEDARERYTAIRRREVTLLSGAVSWSIVAGTVAILAGGVLEIAALLALGVASLLGMIPLAIVIWQYYRGAKDRLLEARYEREAATLVGELGECTVRVRPEGDRPPA